MMASPHRAAWDLATLVGNAAAAPSLTITGLALDSRRTRPGDAFFAVQGVALHGIAFAADAVANGAVAVLTDLAPGDARLEVVPETAALVHIGSDRETVGAIAARFFGAPTEALEVVAVTGTNGKSSVSWLVASALEQLGRDAAVLGTLGGGRPQRRIQQALTTPDPVSLHDFAARLIDEGVTALAMEASSHAIDQARIAGADIDVAVFSNLSRDHLDYHGDMHHYFEAKAALFARDELRARVICIDDAAGRKLYERHASDAIWVAAGDARGEPGRPHLFATDVQAQASGLSIAWRSGDHTGQLTSALIGRFNAQNLMLALATLHALGIELDRAADALSQVAAPPGRLQRAGAQSPAVYVDYAHTPDALAAALAALRPHSRGALWCVFGCGGDRDRGKRAPMARAAATGADHIVVTSDNPRGEAPEAIIADIVAGFGGQPHEVFVDRRDAIAHAVARAADGDTVLIAGKGHETTQRIGASALPFDDVAEARIALARREEVVR
ncbi:MAG: UDP-N-acetylmuramoyl-L-alanyl-D-glutamate--2,6-diaminopimelate ligase [Pseudomonadota bacterium]